MGYYIDQLAERDRQKRLSDLLGYPQQDTVQPNMDRQQLSALLSPEQLSQMNMRTTGFDDQFMARQEPKQQLPQNFIRNERTGAVTDLGQSQQARPIGDMTLGGVSTPWGDGYYMKGDGTRVVLNDGRIVDLARDTVAERARMKENLAMDKARAEIAQIQQKPQSAESRAYQEAIGKARADRDIWTSLPPAMREAEEVKRLGIKLKPGEKYNIQTGEVELIPGSAPYKKQEAEVVEKSTGLSSLNRVIGRMNDIVTDIQQSPGKDAAVGMFDAWAPVIASLTPENKMDARSKIKNLQEYLQTRGLADLRSSGVSPGSVTEKEWEKFAAMIANIDPSMSEKEFDRELANLKTMAASYGAEAAQKVEAYKKQYGPMWDKYAVKNPVGGAQAQSIPDSAVAYLKKNPALRGQFDEKYGAGASVKVLGE